MFTAAPETLRPAGVRDTPSSRLARPSAARVHPLLAQSTVERRLAAATKTGLETRRAYAPAIVLTRIRPTQIDCDLAQNSGVSGSTEAYHPADRRLTGAPVPARSRLLASVCRRRSKRLPAGPSPTPRTSMTFLHVVDDGVVTVQDAEHDVLGQQPTVTL